MKNLIVAVLLVVVTAVSTFVITMNNLRITVSEGAEGALAESCGQVWYVEID